MHNLLETLKDFQNRTVNHAIRFGRCHSLGDLEDHKKFTFGEICQVGTFSVGICRWSARGVHDPSACVVYLAIPEKIMWTNDLVSSLIFKEYWSVTTTESELWLERKVRRPVGPPRTRWWQRQRYAVTLVPERIPDTYTLEEAVMAARLRAEELSGITQAQQEKIAALSKEMKYREEAMRELELV